MHQKRAFTLVELLIVIAIIGILAGLIVGVLFPKIKSMARNSTTEQRINNVIAGLEVYGLANASAMDDLMTLVTNGKTPRLASLREVLVTMQRDHGLDMASAKIGTRKPSVVGVGHWGDNREPTTGTLPPNMAVRSDYKTHPRFGSKLRLNEEFLMPGSGLDYHIMWLDRQWNESKKQVGDFYGPVDNHDAKEAYPWDNGNGWNPRSHHESPVGETLDNTFEVMPTGNWKTQDFYDAWSLITEVTSTDGTEFTQTAWNWDNSTSVRETPIWPWPWGEGKISRRLGTQVEDKQEGTLGDLTPIHTINLLIAASILPNASEGPETYRSDRSPDKAWNDAWGRPLVIGVAAYHAPRYDFDPDKSVTDGTETQSEISNDLWGGRDFFLSRARKTYGSFRGIYVSTATAASTSLPNPWTAADDFDVLTGVWDQALSATGAGSSWDENAMGSPPWNLKTVGSAETSAIISQPRTIRRISK